MKKPRLVLVSWWDAAMQGGWVDDDEAKRIDGTPVDTVGFVLASNKHWIKLGQSNTVGQKGNTIEIPRRWIKNIKELPYDAGPQVQ